MPVIDSCCGLALKVGTIISGILGMVVGALTLVLVFTTNVKVKTIVMGDLPPDYVRIILAINLSMTILISLLLVIGAIKRNQWLMLPWVILAILLAIGVAFSIIYTAVVLFINKAILLGVLWIVIGLACDAFFVYLWVVVFSYYQLLEAEKGRGPYGRPPRR